MSEAHGELQPADDDDGWPCATLIDDLGNVVHAAPDGCEGLVEYPEKRQGARLLYCTRYCEGVAQLVRWRRRVEKEGRHRRPEDGEEVCTALWRKESDLLAGDFYEPRLTKSQREDVFRAKGGRCVECGAPATDIDHILGIGGGDALDNLQPLCRDCHLRKTALTGGMHVSPDPSEVTQSHKWLRATLPRRVWTRANASGIPLFVVNDQPKARRYAEYLCRVYATRPRLCDDDVHWPQVWRQIVSQRRSEIS